MEDFRSRSSVEWRTREAFGPPPPEPGPYDLRCYSMFHGPSYYPPATQQAAESKQGKPSGAGAVTKTPSFRACFSLNDPEMQRKRRVAGYKMYGAEGKIKMSVRKSFKWLKSRYQMVVYGW